MRGKLLIAVLPFQKLRITPADAGKTDGNVIVLVYSADHPRGCGENAVHALCTVCAAGSPPRMRGKQVHLFNCGHDAGITPADAGKTRSARPSPTL